MEDLKKFGEALLRKLLKHVGNGVHFEPHFRCEFDSISVLETISLPTLIVLCWMEISLR